MAFARTAALGTGFGRLGVKKRAGAGAPAGAVGGAALLEGETAGFATDFTYATDASRVAVKVASVNTNYALDAFYTNAGTSPKTVYDVAGTLGWSPHNICLQSQTFDNATWTLNTVTISANATTAPDGTLTADKLVETSATDEHRNQQAWTAVAGFNYTVSCYMKAAERTWAVIDAWDAGNKWTYFNLGSGTVGNLGAGCTATITAVGNGWYRCAVTRTMSGTTAYIQLATSTGNGVLSFAGSATNGIYIWGAQVNRGSAAVNYLPTTTAARIGLAVDYDPVSHAARGLLCEPAATNLAARSNDIGTGWTTAGFTVAQNATGPSGANTAWTLTANAGATNKWTYITIGAGGNYRYSVYAKAGTINWLGIGDASASNAHTAYFNVSAGTVGTVAGRASLGTIEAVGNGWFRCSCTFTASLANISLSIHSADNQTYAWTAVGGETLLVSSAQVETGTVATSYIPTFSATVTRAADVVSVTPASIGNSGTAGSWWADVTFSVFTTNGRIVANTTTNHSPLLQSSATRFGVFEATTLLGPVLGSVTGSHKVACAFQTADRAMSADGLATLADTGSAVNLLAPGAAIYFGSTAAGTAVPNGYIRKLRYVPRRKTNPELVTETTL